MAVHTDYAEHAHELVANMSLQDLEGYDGILAVPPNSLFFHQSALNLNRGCQNTASTILFKAPPAARNNIWPSCFQSEHGSKLLSASRGLV